MPGRSIRNINQLRVLEALRASPGLSRTELVRDTGLGKATVSELVREFIGKGLVREDAAAPEESSVGRRRIKLELSGSNWLAVGVELTGAHCISVVCDLHGRPLRSLITPLRGTTVEGAQRTLVEAVGEVLADFGPAHVVGVGVGVPGVVDSTRRRVVLAENLGWRYVPLADNVEPSLPSAVFLINRNRAGALAEYWYGANKGNRSLVYVSLGLGVGCGIMIGGLLYEGASGAAGEIGHMVLDINGPKCGCGNKGCFEALASRTAIFRRR